MVVTRGPLISIFSRGETFASPWAAGSGKVAQTPPPPALTPTLSQRERGKTSRPHPFPNPRCGLRKGLRGEKRWDVAALCLSDAPAARALFQFPPEGERPEGAHKGD